MADKIIDILDSFLDTQTKKGIPYKKAFIQKFLDEAYKNPNSKAAIILADSIMNGDIGGGGREVDPDFIRYKIVNTCFNQQKEIIENTKFYRRVVMMTSRRAGKTETIARLICFISVIPNSPILYIGLTQTDAISQIFDLIQKVAKEVGLEIVKSSAATGKINFKNGSSVQIGGNRTIRDQESYRGYKFRLVIIDEAQSQRCLNNLIDNILRQTLADFTDSVLVLSGTPPRTKKTYFELAWNNDAWKNYHWTAADNPFMPNWRKTIEEVCKEKGLTENAPFIQREYFGRIAYDTEALIFANFKTFQPQQIQGEWIEPPVNDRQKLSKGIVYDLDTELDFRPNCFYIGIDWGFSDKFSVIGGVFSDSEKRGKIVFEAKASFLNASEMFEVCNNAYNVGLKFQDKYPTINYVELYADTNEGAMLHELSTTYNLPAHKAYKIDKNSHIELLADCCRSGALTVAKGGILEDEFERIVHPRSEEGVMLSGVDDDAFHGDSCDALLYACRRWLYDIGLNGARFKGDNNE